MINKWWIFILALLGGMDIANAFHSDTTFSIIARFMVGIFCLAVAILRIYRG